MALDRPTTYTGYFKPKNKPEDLATMTDIGRVRDDLSALVNETVIEAINNNINMDSEKYATKDKIESLTKKIETLQRAVEGAGLVPSTDLGSGGTSLAKTIINNGMGIK